MSILERDSLFQDRLRINDLDGTARRKLPPSAGYGSDERIVRVPRRTLVLARGDIPEA